MILDVQGVRFGYRSVDVLNDICFQVNSREVLTILGPNGVGKTTLLKCINRILNPQVGTIMIEKQNCCNLSGNELAKRIGYIPQRMEINKIKVYDALLLGRKPYINWDINKKDRDIVNEIIYSLNLGDIALRDLDEISGGELQKVQIGRALVQEPRLLLMDEPTSMLDIKNQHSIMSLVVKEVMERGISMVMTLHDINFALRYSHKFVMMGEGRIMYAGGSTEVSTESIENVYGIKVDVIKHKDFKIVVPV